MTPTVTCEGVWKAYPSHHVRGIKDLLTGRRIERHSRLDREWALQDVSFSAFGGEAFGIVGHNGSGKSTLLSILLGISRPDRGLVRTTGRVASVLELGAGFHPELTGIDNIFVYGSILGMTIKEIQQRFNEIVEFSELGSAIENPIRTYSAGMVARLGFATTIHTPADVLLIDEVLAVGDAAFQEKCLRKLDSFRANGGTLVIVSHDLTSLADICKAGLCLAAGQIISAGAMDRVITDYLGYLQNESDTKDLSVATR